MGQLTRGAQEGATWRQGSWAEFYIKVQRTLLHHLRGVEPGQIMDRPNLTIHLVKITGETTQAQDPVHLQEVEIQVKEARTLDEHIHTAALQADRGNERSA